MSKSLHDGDCDWYSARVCTCGLFLQMMRADKYNEDVSRHANILATLSDQRLADDVGDVEIAG